MLSIICRTFLNEFVLLQIFRVGVAQYGASEHRVEHRTHSGYECTWRIAVVAVCPEWL